MKRFLIPLAITCLVLTGCNKKSEPVFEEDKLIIHTEVQRAFLTDKIERVNVYARGMEELSRPLNSNFSWEGENKQYTVYLSEHEDYSDSFIYTVNENNVSFTNLKIATTYHYKVISGEEFIIEDSFTTSSEIIRNMYVSGSLM